MRYTNMEKSLHFFFSFLLFLLPSSSALNTDGILLLSFKYSILNDPLSVLQNWNYDDPTPCAWTGVTCTDLGTPDSPDLYQQVTSLILPNSHLLGSISPDLGLILNLRYLDLSNNFFNGSLPLSLFSSSSLQVLSLANNVISGKIPSLVGGTLRTLQYLNLSDNALAGEIPTTLTSLSKLRVISLRSNYFSGHVPVGFKTVEVLDLSSNLLNGSVPLDLDIGSLKYLNLSYNKLSGPIPVGFGKHILENATIDVSFNNLTGQIPPTLAMQKQKTDSFAGNLLCGKPMKSLCIIPSTIAIPPNITSSSSSSPAIAAIPKTIDSNTIPNSPNVSQQKQQTGLKPATITAIVIGDLAGIGILAFVSFFVYQLKKKQTTSDDTLIKKNTVPDVHQAIVFQNSPASPENRGYSVWSSCLMMKNEDISEGTSSDTDKDSQMGISTLKYKKDGSLVCVDGETKIDLETLLKASAYVLGNSNSSIVYKAVLEDGSAFAVRRIGEVCVEKMKEFENQVRLIAKLRHQNLVPVRGFYWGDDEKLVIFDYVPNGNLASAINKKLGGSPCHLSLEVRLKIARGVARGLAYIHEKKYVHGNIKPSNILLDTNMEPVISDFGLERLISGYKANSSARFLGSMASSASRDGLLDLPTSISSPNNSTTVGSSMVAGASSYHAPESLKNLKPNPKWDVYSFGIVLLELLTGKVFSDRELSPWASSSTVVEEKDLVLRMADMAIKVDVAAMPDATLAYFKVGFSCASLAPHKRPSMKEALQILEKIPISSC